MQEIIPRSPTSIEELFQNLDVKEDTKKEYATRAKFFITYVDVNGLRLTTLLDFKRYLATIDTFATATKNKYLVCAKVFLRECYRLGYLDRDITSNVKCFEQNKKHKLDGLSDADVTKLLEWMKANELEARTNLIICLLLFQGLRQSEVCRLRFTDIRLEQKKIAVLGKGRDDKEMVALHPNTYKAVKRYLKSIENHSGYLFRSLRGQSEQGGLTTRGLRAIVYRAFEACDIQKNVHGCRHYFTTHLIQAMPGELTRVAYFTRHRSLEMLQVYNDEVINEQSLVSYYGAFATI